ncbi:hypothetical protein U6G28_08875 [Actinomycetaceae bacterium MB13-C1-2]|nr:hypothetical protein U6G28_08875 [Actinomycetaceae bacterium MB13-C1-2]
MSLKVVWTCDECEESTVETTQMHRVELEAFATSHELYGGGMSDLRGFEINVVDDGEGWLIDENPASGTKYFCPTCKIGATNE